MDQKKVEGHLRDLETAIRSLGETAKEMNGGIADRPVIGGVLAAAIGISAQLYGVKAVRTVLGDFVSGEASEQFWVMQQQLHDSEKKAAGASDLAKVPSAPGSIPAP
jgi:hypothetical protein